MCDPAPTMTGVQLPEPVIIAIGRVPPISGLKITMVDERNAPVMLTSPADLNRSSTYITLRRGNTISWSAGLPSCLSPARILTFTVPVAKLPHPLLTKFC